MILGRDPWPSIPHLASRRNPAMHAIALAMFVTCVHPAAPPPGQPMPASGYYWTCCRNACGGGTCCNCNRFTGGVCGYNYRVQFDYPWSQQPAYPPLAMTPHQPMEEVPAYQDETDYFEEHPGNTLPAPQGPVLNQNQQSILRPKTSERMATRVQYWQPQSIRRAAP